MCFLTTNMLPEILENILLLANVESLIGLCMVNKEAYKLCNDKKFWDKKFSLENLPHLLFDNRGYLSKINDCHKIIGTRNNNVYCGIVGTLNNWIIWYYLMIKAYKNAKRMMYNMETKVVQIEKAVHIEFYHDLNYQVSDLYVLNTPVKWWNDTTILLELEGYIAYIYIVLEEKGYRMRIYTTDYDGNMDYHRNASVQHDEVLKVLTLTLFDSYIENRNNIRHEEGKNNIVYETLYYQY